MPERGTIDFSLSEMEFWKRPLPERAAAFARLREQARPLFFEEVDYGTIPPGPGYYALVRHADVVEASRDAKVFASTPSAISKQDLPTEYNEYFGSMINMDDPKHATIRRIVSRAFAPRMLQRFQDQIRETSTRIVDDLLDTGPGDFVTQVAARLPLKFICDMMGIPERDHPMVLELTNTIVGGFDPELLSENAAERVGRVLGAGQAMHDLARELAEFRRKTPADDLTSALVNANVDGEALTDQELGAFFTLLAVAGNETTRNAISYALILLTDNPAQRALLTGDLGKHLPGATEEIVRLSSPVMWMRRTLTCDHELNGHPFRTGDKVLLFYWSANRDAEVFDRPEEFDITRRPNPHVGYGGAGVHFCLGAQLARTEITVLLRELLGRLPDIRADGEPDLLRSSFINGVKHLPCKF
ncbi:cytochrome P450 [Amycolatopsis alba]|uniref:Cytochrome P450 n=1 Tax=Amycolatopsis alba DSM 44262 TaxID=1125972 RepID=A0A229REX0_AMYAL|nr:cytochrome P450 [Amycolatopsis alba]OXM45188.1 cytochrome P450 [Amycolatopsis alba DSM 44262]